MQYKISLDKARSLHKEWTATSVQHQNTKRLKSNGWRKGRRESQVFNNSLKEREEEMKCAARIILIFMNICIKKIRVNVDKYTDCHTWQIMLTCEVQYYTIQYSAVQYSTVQYSTVEYNTIKYSTVQYSTVQYSTVQYSTVQYSTVQYSTVQYFP